MEPERPHMLEVLIIDVLAFSHYRSPIEDDVQVLLEKNIPRQILDRDDSLISGIHLAMTIQSDAIEAALIIVALLSFFEKAIIKTCIDKLWVLQNAVIALTGLGNTIPVSLDHSLSLLIPIVFLDLFGFDEVSNHIFDFSMTEPYSYQME